MRFSILAISALLVFGGCAEKGAFDLFKMDEAHERAVEQLRTGSIVLSLETKAIMSTLYLNPIYPEHYNDGEYFIGALYFLSFPTSTLGMQTDAIHSQAGAWEREKGVV